MRLAIVDLLTCSDRSPSELRRRLGIGSNLLSHHLRALEGVGLISGTPSGGDGRRRYLRLRAEALPMLGPAAARTPQRVLFICTGNSARSQLAAALWRARVGTRAWSAGTHPAPRIHPRAVAAARRAGLDLSGRAPRRLADVDVRPELVVTVCDRAHEELSPPDAWLHWSVPDPVPVGTSGAFDAALEELDRRITQMVPPPAPTVKRSNDTRGSRR